MVIPQLQILPWKRGLTTSSVVARTNAMPLMTSLWTLLRTNSSGDLHKNSRFPQGKWWDNIHNCLKLSKTLRPMMSTMRRKMRTRIKRASWISFINMRSSRIHYNLGLTCALKVTIHLSSKKILMASRFKALWTLRKKEINRSAMVVWNQWKRESNNARLTMKITLLLQKNLRKTSLVALCSAPRTLSLKNPQRYSLAFRRRLRMILDWALTAKLSGKYRYISYDQDNV